MITDPESLPPDPNQPKQPPPELRPTPEMIEKIIGEIADQSAKRLPASWRFLLLAFSVGSGVGRFVSNGSPQEVIPLLEDFLKKQKAQINGNPGPNPEGTLPPIGGA